MLEIIKVVLALAVAAPKAPYAKGVFSHLS